MAITKVTEGVRTLGTDEVATANMATDPTNASNLSSGSVPTAQLGNVDTSGITANKDDIALLGFKVASNGSLGKYNLVDQVVDDFQDESGVNFSSSSNAYRDSTGKYYIGDSRPSGGTITTWSTYTVHEFKSSGTFTLSDDLMMVDVLVVGGGGGGGAVFSTPGGGGGGAGGYIYTEDFAMSAGAQTITIGTGGAGSTDADTKGANGVDTTVGSLLTAKGGGGGGIYGGSSDNKPGADGGSGGGGSWTPGPGGSETQTGQAGTSGSDGFGNDGGSGHNQSGQGGAGGGGAGAAGQDMHSSGEPGAGGVGKSTTMVDNTTMFFAGGGGGGEGYQSSSGAAGGNGGGGAGGTETGSAFNGIAGTANTGGGGGGGGTNSGGQDADGGNGGSGVVYFRYTTSGSGAIANLTLISNAVTAEAVPTKADLVMTYSDGEGTATVGTDLTAEVSRDGGTTYTSFGLSATSDQGTTGGHTILTAHDLDISGQPSGSSMLYRIKTLNQSAGSKETRIQAVSLGWS